MTVRETATLEFRSEISQAQAGVERLKGGLDELKGKAVEGANDAAFATGKWLRNVIGLAAAYVTVRATMQFLGSALQEHQRLERSMADYRAATGAARDEVEGLRRDLLGMATTSGVALADAFGALKEVTGAGFDPQGGGLGVLQEALNLSRLASLDLNDAVTILTATMAAYDLAAEEAGRASGVLWGATKEGRLQTEELQRAFQLTGPTARALGVDLETTAAALAVLTNAGRSGKQATQEYKAVLEALLAPTAAWSEAVAELGLEYASADAIAKHGLLATLSELAALSPETFERLVQSLGGVEAQTALREMVGGLDEFTTSLEALRESADATSTDVGVLNETWGALTARLSASWTNTKAVIGEGLAAVLSGPLTALADGLEAFALRLEDVRETYRTVLAAGGTELEANRAAWDELKAAIEDTLGPTFRAAWEELKETLSQVDWGQVFADLIVGAFRLAIDALKILWVEFWQNLPAIVGGVITLTVELVKGMLSAIFDLIGDIVGAIKDAIVAAVDFLWDKFKGFFAWLWDQFTSWLAASQASGEAFGQFIGGNFGVPPPEGRQYGGMVGAPDRVPARLAVGEHVMRREVAQAPGMGELLGALNSMGPAALNVHLPNVTDRATAMQVAPRLASGMGRFQRVGGVR